MENIKQKIVNALCNRTVRKILFLLSLVVSILCLVTIYSISPKQDRGFQNQLDALEKKSQELLQQQAKYDSAIHSQEQYVQELESKITNIKEKTTIIKEYYTKVQERVNDYDHDQVDSFFRQKYNY